PEEGGRITILQPHTPPQEEALPAVSAQNQGVVRDMLRSHLSTINLERPIRWHYAPMATYLAGVIPERALVYDCMDELSAFKGAPPELMERERDLLREADLVLTGGRSLHLSKREHNRNTQPVDSGVDVEHVGKVTTSETP